MTSIMLSKRLLQLVQCIPPQSTVADIGTDHAMCQYFWCESAGHSGHCGGYRETAIGGARRNIETRLGHSHGIDLRCGGGLAVLKSGEVDTEVIVPEWAVRRIKAILSDRLAHSQSFERFILQPNKGWTGLRQFLWANGFAIEAEHIR